MKEQTSYVAIGTETGTTISPATLTASYADNINTFFRRYLNKVHLDIKYTPKAAQTNRYADILVEYSPDGSNWFPASTQIATVAETDVFVSGTDSTTGIPIVVPGDKTSTGNTAYPTTADFEIADDWVRISARESGTTNFGTLFVNVTFAS